MVLHCDCLSQLRIIFNSFNFNPVDLDFVCWMNIGRKVCFASVLWDRFLISYLIALAVALICCLYTCLWIINPIFLHRLSVCLFFFFYSIALSSWHGAKVLIGTSLSRRRACWYRIYGLLWSSSSDDCGGVFKSDCFRSSMKFSMSRSSVFLCRIFYLFGLGFSLVTSSWKLCLLLRAFKSLTVEIGTFFHNNKCGLVYYVDVVFVIVSRKSERSSWNSVRLWLFFWLVEECSTCKQNRAERSVCTVLEY